MISMGSVASQAGALRLNLDLGLNEIWENVKFGGVRRVDSVPNRNAG
jgi:hypothetical protein